MSFLVNISAFDLSPISALLIVAGLVTMWIGRPIAAGVSTAELGLSLPIPDFAAHVRAWQERRRKARARRAAVVVEPATWVKDNAAVAESVAAPVRSASSAKPVASAALLDRSRAGAGRLLALRRPATVVAAVAPLPARLTVERQIELLEIRVNRAITATRDSQTMHLGAARQLDAADYALEQLKTELAAVFAPRPAASQLTLFPQPTRAVVRRPAPARLPEPLAA
ncbi:MAG: hypothetical protein JNM89_14970 [Hyphomicrobiaceae bacterium]|nr:hypothetical protein [Hyphomicrobiaceae bacterium]